VSSCYILYYFFELLAKREKIVSFITTLVVIFSFNFHATANPSTDEDSDSTSEKRKIVRVKKEAKDLRKPAERKVTKAIKRKVPSKKKPVIRKAFNFSTLEYYKEHSNNFTAYMMERERVPALRKVNSESLP
jgi:hypothetical protein